MGSNSDILENLIHVQALRNYGLDKEYSWSAYVQKIVTIRQGLTKALFGSEIRPYVVKYLLKNGSSKLSDISSDLNVTQASVLTSIQPLINKRIINVDISGIKKYSINESLGPKVIELAQNICKVLDDIEKYAIMLANED